MLLADYQALLGGDSTDEDMLLADLQAQKTKVWGFTVRSAAYCAGGPTVVLRNQLLIPY